MPNSAGQKAQAQQAQTQQPQAQAPLRTRERKPVRLPGEELSLQETLRVLDVARELRQQRETAEEMFRRDDVRYRLRNKLLQTARMSGDTVTEAEIDAAIDQYLDNVHTYTDPEPGLKNFVAHCWVWRGRILAGLSILAAVAAASGLSFLF